MFISILLFTLKETPFLLLSLAADQPDQLSSENILLIGDELLTAFLPQCQELAEFVM